jgi:hypothetical protein
MQRRIKRSWALFQAKSKHEAGWPDLQVRDWPDEIKGGMQWNCGILLSCGGVEMELRQFLFWNSPRMGTGWADLKTPLCQMRIGRVI